ncbi:restin homolog isoform X3 [Toxorhynchites rutilus septentrionalis]|uniref:restin homolog isoform X3 n=1 Tax=Toxorhynchites rutilus septentrionalis TaxID=329112 RepID=UPI00247AC275|nr:restin homolog isoform X3 [Toxorhynchites rutilus septentrionalis]
MSEPTNGASADADEGRTNGSTDAKPSGIQPPKLRALPKPSGMRPPSMSLSSSTTSLASTSSTAPVASKVTTGVPASPTVAAPSRIGRPCQGHIAPKAGLPSPEPKNGSSDTTSSILASRMRRPSDTDYSKSLLADVDEESETDLANERTLRSSHSPDSGFRSNRTSQDRKTSNQGVVLTTDTDGFIIGQRVWVGGLRPGHIAYIGETHFAPGDWAGVVLDEPNGKNDGSVSGKRYFQCEPKKGVFSRLTRLTREPLPGASGGMSGGESSLDHSVRSLTSPVRSGAVSPTHSVSSFASKSPAMGKAATLSVGDRVIVSSGFGSRPGILMFLGETQFASGNWCGVQLDEPSGKNDGSVDGVKYFECPSKYGIFVPIAKVTLSPSSRKTRLSRSGSKESLTSVGTMSSIATTATSRLRMSAQRKSSVSTVPSTPKASFSLQDVLREKQNHIEQLIREREIDREEGANQTIMYQKNVQQLKEKIAKLEAQLSEEKRRNEDLQFSVDEVTFCGDELSGKTQNSLQAQTQIYKERIAELEKQVGVIKPLVQTEPDLPIQKQVGSAELNLEIDKLKAELVQRDQRLQLAGELKQSLEDEIKKLHERLADSEKDIDIKVSSYHISEQCLKEKIAYLQDQLDLLGVELTAKDAEMEKQYLDLRNAEGQRDEEVSQLQNDLRSKEALEAERDKLVEKLTAEVETLLGDIRQRDVKLLEGESGLKSVLEEKDGQISRLKKELQDLEAQKVSSELVYAEMSKKVSDLNAKLVSTEEQLAKHEESVKELKKTQQSFEESLKSKDKLIAERDLLLGEIQEQLKASSDGNEQQLALLCAKESELEQRQQEVDLKQYQISNLEAAVANLSQKLEEAEKDRESRQIEHQASVDFLKKSNDDLLKKVTNFETELLAKEKLQEESETLVSALQSELKELNVAKSTLTRELDDMRNSFTDRDGALVKISAEKAQLAEELEKVRKESNSAVALLEERLKNAQAQHEVDLRKANETLEKETKAKESVICELEASVEKLTHQRIELVAELDSIKLTQKNVTDELTGKNSEIQELHKQINTLEVDVSSKTENLAKLHQSLSEGNTKIETGEKRLSDLQESFGKLEIEHADLKRKMEALEQKSTQIQQQKTDLEKEIHTLRSSTLDSNSELARTVEELSLKQKALEELQDAFDATKIDMERRLDEASQTNSNLNEQIERLRGEMQQISSQKIDRENELNVELAKIKETSEVEKDNLVREIAGLKASFEEERNRMMSEAEIKLTEYDTEKREMTSTADQLRETLEKMTAELQRTKENYEKEKQEAGHRWEQQNETQKSLMDQIENLQKVKTDLRKEISDLKRLNEEQGHGASALLDAKNNRISELEQELKTVQDEFNTKQAECIESCRKLEQNVETHSELLKQLEGYLSQIQELTNKKSSVESEHQHLSTAWNDLKEKYQEMEEEQVDLVNREEILKEQLEQLKIQVETTEGQNLNYVSQLNSKAQESIKLSEEIQSLKSLLEQEKNRLESAVSEKETTIQEMSTKLEKLTPLVKLTEELQAEINSKTQLIGQQEDDIQKQNAERENQQKTIQEQRSALEQRDTELQQLREALSQKTTTTDQLTAKLQSLEMCLTATNEEGQKGATEIANLKAQLEKSASAAKEQNETLKDRNRTIAELETKLSAQSEQLEEQLNRKKTSETKSSQIMHELNQKLLELEKMKQQEIVELQALLADTTNRYETLMTESRRTEESVRSTGKRHQQLEYEKQELQLRETEMQIENRKLQRETELLRAQLATKEGEIKKLSQEVASGTTPASILPVAAGYLSSNDENDPSQIDFLKSIIVDMQRKNDKLKLRIQAMEQTSIDGISHNSSFEFSKRKPVPRMFCDICDEFDQHETEDCPKQGSDSPPESLKHPLGDEKERKIPPPRKYCEGCEVFGHEFGECPDDETY